MHNEAHTFHLHSAQQNSLQELLPVPNSLPLQAKKTPCRQDVKAVGRPFPAIHVRYGWQLTGLEPSLDWKRPHNALVALIASAISAGPEYLLPLPLPGLTVEYLVDVRSYPETSVASAAPVPLPTRPGRPPAG